MVKNCAFRRSKTYPNVYLRNELVDMALERGATKAEIRSMKKKDLCEYLDIPWVVPPKPVREPRKPREGLIMLGNRPCNINKSKLRPNVFTKDELVTLAIQNLDMEIKEAKKLNKSELCRRLNSEGVEVPDYEPEEIVIISKKLPKKKKPSKKPSLRKKRKPQVEEEEELIIEEKPPRKKRKTPPKKKAPLKGKRGPRKTKPNGKQKESPPPKKRSGNCIDRSLIPLKPHQEEIVKYLENHRGAVAAFGTGSGKTLTAVTTSQCFLDKHPDWKVIVVTPLSLQENFKKEMIAYGANPKDKRYKFYTIAGFAKEYQNKKCSKKTLLIIDEAHNLRTPISKTKTSRSKVAIKCAKNVDKVLLLTATPVYNNPYDTANLVAMVKGKKPLTLREFKAMMSKKGSMRKYFKCVFFFYDVPKTSDYPDVIEKDIRIIMTPEYYRKYRSVENQESHLFKPGDPFIFLTKVRQATNAFEPCQKCIWAVNKIKEGGKTILYSAFKAYGIERIQKLLDQEGIKYGVISGETSAKKGKDDRAKYVNQFNKGDFNVLFITKAGGEGLDLKGVKNVIILESGWNRAGEEQIIGRAARYKSHANLPKSERKVHVYHLTLIKPINKDPSDEEDSADEILKNSIRMKEKEDKEFIEMLKELSIDKYGNCL